MMDAQQKADEGSLVLPKRKYQKRKTESKISVRHYLNTRIITYQKKSGYTHPLYVQVVYKGKTNNFKSFLHFTSSVENFDKLQQDYRYELESEVNFFREQIRISGNIISDLRFSAEINGWDMRDIVDEIRKYIGNLLWKIYDLNVSNLELKIKQNESDKEYKRILRNMEVICAAIDFHSVKYNELLCALEVLFIDNEDIRKLKTDFFDEPNFLEILFDNTNLHTTQNTVVGWKAGLTQMYIRSHYRGSEYEHLCEKYITSVDSLLAQEDLNVTIITD